MNIEPKETGNVDQMISVLQTFFEEATDTVEELIDSDLAQDALIVGHEIGASLSDAIKGYKAIKAISSIPTKLYLYKFDKFCKGLYEIPIEKRQAFIQKLGHHKFNQESYFILNSINRIEEEEKIPFLVKLLDARTDGIIDADEYRRLTILVDRTMYSDLVYLQHHITSNPVALSTDSDYGLVASGLLVTAGNEWVGDYVNPHNPSDTGIRFNYTLAAKKLSQIIWGISCDLEPSNEGLVFLQTVSDEEIDSMFK